MTTRKLRYSVGLFLLASHFGLLLVVVALYFLNGFAIDEFTTVIAILAPVFAGYTTSILAYIIGDANTMKDTTARVTRTYAALAFAVPLTMIAIIGVSLILKAYNRVFDDFEEFKRFFLLVESMFAAYAGMFVYSLFDRKAPVGVPGEKAEE
jgi:hypothetical protein